MPIRRYRSDELKEFANLWDRSRAAQQDALLIVRYFNARLSTSKSAGFWPTIGTALAAKHPWVEVLCESCGMIADVDIRMKPRDPQASVRVILRDVKCPRCNSHGRPRIVGLTKFPRT
jgi:hypothetical protein